MDEITTLMERNTSMASGSLPVYTKLKRVLSMMEASRGEKFTNASGGNRWGKGNQQTAPTNIAASATTSPVTPTGGIRLNDKAILIDTFTPGKFTAPVLRSKAYYNTPAGNVWYIAATGPCPVCYGSSTSSVPHHAPKCIATQCTKCGLYGHTPEVCCNAPKKN